MFTLYTAVVVHKTVVSVPTDLWREWTFGKVNLFGSLNFVKYPCFYWCGVYGGSLTDGAGDLNSPPPPLPAADTHVDAHCLRPRTTQRSA